MPQNLMLQANLFLVIELLTAVIASCADAFGSALLVVLHAREEEGIRRESGVKHSCAHRYTDRTCIIDIALSIACVVPA